MHLQNIYMYLCICVNMYMCMHARFGQIIPGWHLKNSLIETKYHALQSSLLEKLSV